MHFTLKIIIKKNSQHTHTHSLLRTNFVHGYLVGKMFGLIFFFVLHLTFLFVCFWCTYMYGNVWRKQFYAGNLTSYLQKQFLFDYQKLIWKIFAKLLLFSFISILLYWIYYIVSIILFNLLAYTFCFDEGY